MLCRLKSYTILYRKKTKNFFIFAQITQKNTKIYTKQQQKTQKNQGHPPHAYALAAIVISPNFLRIVAARLSYFVNSRSPLWLSIKASVTGCRMIPLTARESGCMGAALLAGVGVGRYPDIDTAAQGLALTGNAIMPDPSMKPCYDEAFRRYVALYESLKPFFAMSS